MKYTNDTRIIVFICCLLQGFAVGLRMIKVSIPAYKLRGESAFLECQYELNRTHHTVTGLQSHSDHAHGHNTHAGEFHYPDGDALEDERSSYRSRMRQSQRQHGQRPRQREPIAMRQYQSQQSHQQLPAPPEKSPYGHSVYRGSAASGYLGAAHVGASTHSGSVSVSNGNSNGVPAAYMPDFDRADSFDDSHDREEEEDEDEEEQPEEGEALYAIKWYKDNEEFYRYVPKARPPKTSYRVDGVRVIEELSDASRVLLRGLTLNSTGLYRCEVSAEAPNFSSVQGEGRMDIVFLPRDGPHIRGQQYQYQIGEYLYLNCTSGKSHPASHLQWFVNEQPILDEHYLHKYNDIVHKHGLITSTLGLQLPLEPRHFHEGDMRVKCLASISPVLWKGGKESVLQRRPGIIDNREAMLLGE
uniref:Beaten path IV, isoform A n=1 Tax=Drosophila melanogaster TaxID=7227 RepID=Q9VCL1_DROME|nr:beaten path IV, isoform A [Drosophila melanogaster]AAF56147.2 beaten path IV, isoform A [Drosophila melanogaster]AAL39249.1 GH12267p [Drosophila melanogaster]|eukprot:NP_651156.1 beat-IV, isoform A [Drosophila melanogaster]